MPDVSIATGEMVREESMAGKIVGIKTKIHWVCIIHYLSTGEWKGGGGEWDDLSCVTCVTIKFIWSPHKAMQYSLLGFKEELNVNDYQVIFLVCPELKFLDSKIALNSYCYSAEIIFLFYHDAEY